MQLKLASLASVIVFATGFSHVAANSHRAYAMGVKYLVQATVQEINNTAPLPGMASNGTLPDGQICYQDKWYSAFQNLPLTDVIPFCSVSVLHIPASTITTAYTTATVTYTTVAVTYYPVASTTIVPETTDTVYTTETSFFPVQAPAPTMMARAAQAIPKHMQLLESALSCTDPILSSLSSACSCLRIQPGTTSICYTTTTTSALSGFIYRPSQSVVVVSDGIATTTETVEVYKPSTMRASGSVATLSTIAASESISRSVNGSTPASASSFASATASFNISSSVSAASVTPTSIRSVSDSISSSVNATGTVPSSAAPVVTTTVQVDPSGSTIISPVTSPASSASSASMISPPSLSFSDGDRYTTVVVTTISGRPVTITEVVYSSTTLTVMSDITETTTVYQTVYPSGLSSIAPFPSTNATGTGTPIFTTTAISAPFPSTNGTASASSGVASSSGAPFPSINGTVTSSASLSPSSGFPSPSANITRGPPPPLSFSVGDRHTSIVTTTGTAGEAITLTEVIGSNYTVTLGYTSTAIATVVTTITPTGAPFPSSNSTRSAGSAGSSGLPVPSSNSTRVPVASPTPYANSTTMSASANTSFAIPPFPSTTDEPRSFSLSTASNGAVTSYPYYTEISSSQAIYPYTTVYTITTTVTVTGAMTSGYTSEISAIYPNGTGIISYEIPAPTGGSLPPPGPGPISIPSSQDPSASVSAVTSASGGSAGSPASSPIIFTPSVGGDPAIPTPAPVPSDVPPQYTAYSEISWASSPAAASSDIGSAVSSGSTSASATESASTAAFGVRGADEILNDSSSGHVSEIMEMKEERTLIGRSWWRVYL